MRENVIEIFGTKGAFRTSGDFKNQLISHSVVVERVKNWLFHFPFCFILRFNLFGTYNVNIFFIEKFQIFPQLSNLRGNFFVKKI